MRIVFCSSIFDLSKYDAMKKNCKTALTLADHNLNFSFIRGLDSLLENKVDLINSVPTPSFPSYNKIWIKSQKWHHTSGAKDINIGFVNLPILKQITRGYNIYNQLKKKAKSSKGKKLVIMTYDVHLEQAAAIIRIKKKFPNVITCMIMPDIPTQMLALGSSSNVQRLAAEKRMKYASQMDAYVFLTEYMKEYVDVSNKYYTVVEGIYDADSHQTSNKYTPGKTSRNVVLYSGNLRRAYGLDFLIEAVQQLAYEKGNYELWICGQGELANKILTISKENQWLKYLGYVTPPQIYDVFSQATILVNPRLNEPYTKYSFPSKTLEYLATGKPVIAYKLDGIPDEYDAHIHYVSVDGDPVTSLKYKITEVCSIPFEVRQMNGERAKKFVLEKSPIKQCEKVVNMLSTIEKQASV